MRVVGIDPGMASLGIVLMDGKTLVDFADFRTVKTGARSLNEDGVKRSQFMAAKVAEFINKNEPVDVVIVEEFVTRSGRAYASAWETPFAIGYIVNDLLDAGCEVRFRSASRLPERAIRDKAWSNYCKTREGLSRINILPKSRREHVICAALHAIGHIEEGGAQKRK